MRLWNSKVFTAFPTFDVPGAADLETDAAGVGIRPHRPRLNDPASYGRHPSNAVIQGILVEPRIFETWWRHNLLEHFMHAPLKAEQVGDRFLVAQANDPWPFECRDSRGPIALIPRYTNVGQ